MRRRPPRCGARNGALIALAAVVLAGFTAAGWPVPPAPAVAAAASRSTAPAPAKTVPGYWLVASDGGVFSFGGVGYYGSTGGTTLNRPIVGMARTHDSAGYWLVAADGGVFTFGDARFYGSTGNLVLNRPVVAMAPTPDGRGYWLVASDGGVFTFGDAGFYGSTGNLVLNRPVVAMAPTTDGRGYWLVASDGGVFAFGDARFYGSTGHLTLNSPVVGMTTSPDGRGYAFVAGDGGVFTFGDARNWGSLGGEPLSRPIAAMAGTPSGDGYWLSDDNGAVSSFGSAGYFGSAPQVLRHPVVGMVEGAGTGAFAGQPYQSGSYGYDLSNYQCSQTLPSGHAIGIVEVEGASFGAVNPCLGSETRWAGAGLNLYIYLTYGTSTTGPASCHGDLACNDGFAVARDAFAKATAAKVDTQVTWWLDVEPDPSWTADTEQNAQMVMGGLAGLRAEGINNVGIYASPDTWNGIVGSYQPAVPLWMALWLTPASGPGSSAAAPDERQSNLLPTGPVVVVQYTDDAQYAAGVPGVDGDYAC